MKSKYIIAALAVPFIFASCSSNSDSDITSNDIIKVTLGADSEDGISGGDLSDITRTHIDSKKGPAAESPKIEWDLGDQISLFSDAEPTVNRCFSATKLDASYDNRAYFTGETKEGSKYLFLYPYQKTATYDGNMSITADIPSEQQGVANCFAKNSMLQVGYVKSTNTDQANFKCVVSFLYITVPEGVDHVELSSTNADGSTYALAGRIKITANSSGSPITEWVSRAEKVTLNIPNGAAGCYAACVAPSEGYPNLKVKVCYTNGTTKVATKTTEFTLVSNHFYSLGDLSN